MSWFLKLCRNAGLMVHNVKHPDGSIHKTVKKTVEETKIDETTTLRRTTIDEIEIKQKSP